MTAVFADASYYVALLSPRDQHHADAVRISRQLGNRLWSVNSCWSKSATH